MKTFTLLSALAFAMLGACASSASAHASEGPVRLGQTAHVGGPRVTPLRLVEDSRCPMNAHCIRAGTVVVRTRVSGGRWSRIVDLTLGQPTPVADGALTLVAATPERMAGERLDPKRMRFTFDFQGGL